MNELAIACWTQCAASLFLTETAALQSRVGSGELFPLFKEDRNRMIFMYLEDSIKDSRTCIFTPTRTEHPIIYTLTVRWVQSDSRTNDSHEQVLFSDSWVININWDQCSPIPYRTSLMNRSVLVTHKHTSPTVQHEPERTTHMSRLFFCEWQTFSVTVVVQFQNK